MKGDLRDEKLLKIADSIVECWDYFHLEPDFLKWRDELACRLSPAHREDFREYVERKIDERAAPNPDNSR